METEPRNTQTNSERHRVCVSVCGCVLILIVFVGKMFWSLKKVSKELRPGRLSSTFKRKRLDFPMTIIDGVVFKILSVVEGVVLVSALYFFYLCCGCHI
ncbi:putative Transmembrane protein [Fagus crenata]